LVDINIWHVEVRKENTNSPEPQILETQRKLAGSDNLAMQQTSYLLHFNV